MQAQNDAESQAIAWKTILPSKSLPENFVANALVPIDAAAVPISTAIRL